MKMPSIVFQSCIVIFCLLVLTSCAPDFTTTEKTGQSEPNLQETLFISYDGTKLPLQVWHPSNQMDDAKFIFIAVHGFNDYSNFIKSSAQYFIRHQITVYAYDQRGFGNAPVRGRWGSSEAMAKDLKTLIRLITRKHPGQTLYLLGHSMGGAVIIQAMSGENHPDVAGAILIAPALWARSTSPFYQNFALWLAAHTVPWYQLTGNALYEKPSDNIEMLKNQGRDPMVIKETRSDTIYGLQNLMDSAYSAADNYKLKTLVLYGLLDEVIPKKPILDAFLRFPYQSAGQKQLILYENGYHMLLRDLQAENVMNDIVLWINN